MQHPHENGPRDGAADGIVTVFLAVILLWGALAFEAAGAGIPILSWLALLLGLPVIVGGIILGIVAWMSP